MAMTQRLKPLSICLIFAVALTLFIPDAAYATFVPWQFRIGAQAINCQAFLALAPDTFYTVQIVQCLQSYIREVAYYFLEYTTAFFYPATMALILLVITLFGIKVASQARELKTEAIMLLLKIGLVLYFVDNFGGLAPAAFSTLENAVGFITQSLRVGSVTSPADGCVITTYMALIPGLANLAGWAKLDCLIGQIIGFGPSIAMAGAIFGMIGSMLFSGSIGIMVFFIGLFVLVSLIMFVLRCVYIYFLSYVMLAVMIIISPLVIPFVLLPQSVRQTFDIFTSWLGYIFNAMITPLVLFAFLSIAFNIFDYFIINEQNPSSLNNVLKGTFMVDGTPRPGGPANPESYYEYAQRCFKMSSFTDPSFYQKIPDALEQMSEGDLLSPVKSGQNDAASFLPGCAGLDFGEEQQQRLQEIAFSLLQVLVAGYLMLTMMSMIPDIAGSLAGGGSALTSAAASSMGVESSVASSMRQSESFVSNMTNTSFRFGSLVGKRP